MIKPVYRAWGVSVMVCPGFGFQVIIVFAMGEDVYKMPSTAEGWHLVLSENGRNFLDKAVPAGSRFPAFRFISCRPCLYLIRGHEVSLDKI